MVVTCGSISRENALQRKLSDFGLQSLAVRCDISTRKGSSIVMSSRTMSCWTRKDMSTWQISYVLYPDPKSNGGKLTTSPLQNVASDFRPGKPLTSKSGTLAYLAPEVYEGNGYYSEVDWWGLGVCFYECVYSKVCSFSPSLINPGAELTCDIATV